MRLSIGDMHGKKWTFLCKAYAFMYVFIHYMYFFRVSNHEVVFTVGLGIMLVKQREIGL